MGRTGIEWATDTLNPGLYGCDMESPACAHCYAMGMAARLERMGQVEYAGTTRDGRWVGGVRVVDVAEAVRRVLAYPRRIFVTSMSDILHRDVPLAWIVEVIVAMAARPDCDWLLLTKRAARWPEVAAAVVARLGSWPRHVWPGVTVEDQRRADERIPFLLEVPDAVRWLSMEPLLGRVDLTMVRDPRTDSAFWAARDVLRGANRIEWGIVGGESGAHARPSHPAWFRSVRDQCVAADVPFLFKQHGEWGPHDGVTPYSTLDGAAGSPPAYLVDDAGHVHCTREAAGAGAEVVLRYGKKAAGRLLDGATWDQLPVAA